jgi:hypothetical protein
MSFFCCFFWVIGFLVWIFFWFVAHDLTKMGDLHSGFAHLGRLCHFLLGDRCAHLFQEFYGIDNNF